MGSCPDTDIDPNIVLCATTPRHLYSPSTGLPALHGKLILIFRVKQVKILN